jgi:hypothetical protein
MGLVKYVESPEGQQTNLDIPDDWRAQAPDAQSVLAVQGVEAATGLVEEVVVAATGRELGVAVAATGLVVEDVGAATGRKLGVVVAATGLVVEDVGAATGRKLGVGVVVDDDDVVSPKAGDNRVPSPPLSFWHFPEMQNPPMRAPMRTSIPSNQYSVLLLILKTTVPLSCSSLDAGGGRVGSTLLVGT